MALVEEPIPYDATAARAPAPTIATKPVPDVRLGFRRAHDARAPAQAPRSGSSGSSPSCPEGWTRPLIHVYPNPLPPWSRAADWRFPKLREAIRRSDHHVGGSGRRAADAMCADYFFMSNQEAAGGVKSTEKVILMFARLARRYPFWNRSLHEVQARHLLLSPCDHGPGDCMYDRRINFRPSTPEAQVPRALNPASAQRKVAYLGTNGMPGGTNHHIHGLDIRLPQGEEHNCGPLCGSRSLPQREARHVLRQLSPWSMDRGVAERLDMLRAPRPLRLFFSGKIDGGGGGNRDQLMRRLARRPGFLLRDTSGTQHTVEGRSNYTAGSAAAAAMAGLELSGLDLMARGMASSDFCLSPLGQNDGDSDRYLPAILYGCIPIFLSPGEEPPFSEVPHLIPWRNISLRLGTEDAAQLPRILARIGPAQVVAMRLAMAPVWRRLLWTRLSGSYLGEDATSDAFETLMEVLRRRLASGAHPHLVDKLRVDELRGRVGRGGEADESRALPLARVLLAGRTADQATLMRQPNTHLQAALRTRGLATEGGKKVLVARLIESCRSSYERYHTNHS